MVGQLKSDDRRGEMGGGIRPKPLFVARMLGMDAEGRCLSVLNECMNGI